VVDITKLLDFKLCLPGEATTAGTFSVPLKSLSVLTGLLSAAGPAASLFLKVFKK
jgi:hypothetical protein